MAESSAKTKGYSELKQLKAEIELLKEKLHPDSIAKAVDRGYLSISNLRCSLGILSIILTIFVVVAGAFGFLGVKNILSIRNEALRVQEVREKVESDANSVAIAVNSVEVQIRAVKDDTLKETRKLIGKVQSEVDDLEKEYRTMASVFNTVAGSQADVLSVREMQLLVLLAKEIDPNHPVYNLNAAQVSYRLGDYGRVVESCDKLIASTNSPAIAARAKQLKEKAEVAKPRKFPQIKGSGFSQGNYNLLALSVSTLHVLSDKGYLTMEETNSILDSADKTK